MKLINVKISYKTSENKIETDLLCSNDYKIVIENKQNSLFCKIETSKVLQDFNINFILDFDKDFDCFLKNGYQGWSKSKIAYKSQNCKATNLKSFLLKNTGWDYTSDINNNKDNSSYGIFYLKNSTTNKTLLFYSLDEKTAFTKFTCNLKDKTLTINKNFCGKMINKDTTICNIICFEGAFENCFDNLRQILQPKTQNQLAIYSTFLDKTITQSEKEIANKLQNLPKTYNTVLIGDGYCKKGYFANDFDDKRFCNGFFNIVEKIKKNGFLSAIWIAPFAITQNSKYFQNYQDCVLKKNGTPIITCPYWGGACSLDITNTKTLTYLQNLFDNLTNKYKFDIIFCDVVFMASCVATNGKTTAELANKAVDLLKKLASDKILILGGVPSTVAFGKCDYICINTDIANKKYSLLENLCNQTILSYKTSANNLTAKNFYPLIYPSVAYLPNNKIIFGNLFKNLNEYNFNYIIPENLLKKNK